MKKSRTLALLLLFAMILALAGCSGTAAATPTPTAAPTATPEPASIKIGIVQYVEHPALDASREGFIAALKDNGYEDGKNITLDVQNAQADQSNLKTISQRFVSNEDDLILAIATPAAQSVASETTTIPILGTAITDYTVAKLVNSDEAPGGNVTGTTDMNPIEDQIKLMQKLVPDVKTVGLLYTSSEDNSVLQAELVKEACDALGLTVVEGTVTSSNEVQQVTQSIVGKVDAIYIPTDNTFASAMPIVSQITTEAKVPTICGESNMVLGGGLATLGIDYYNLGYQTGLMAVKVLKGEATPATMPVESQTDYAFTINGDVAEAIGLTIPSDLADAVVYPSKK
jgi:putative ABC transport system substrate-binding protein